jgi:DNA repair exonuclease SbcCD nuclease subunit
MAWKKNFVYGRMGHGSFGEIKMSKIGMVGDIHFGIKNSSTFMLEYQVDFYLNNMFPKFKELGITDFLFTGDFFHSRKSLDFSVYHSVKERFLDKLKEFGLTMWMVPGNHDLYYTDSSEITSLSVLEECENVKVIKVPTVITLGGLNIGMVPWISNEDEQKVFDNFCKSCSASILFGHFEIKGFEYSPGIIQAHGIDEETMKGFERVYSGHFHGKQIKGNIYILGTPYELDWGDYGKDKGFYVLDTKTHDVEFYPNTKNIHVKLEYDESKLEDLQAQVKELKNKIVKVIVKNKTDDAKFSALVYQIENAGVVNSTVIDNPEQEDGFELDLEKSQSIVEVIDEYIDKTYTDPNKINLYKKIMVKLYDEAMKEKSGV